MATVFAAILVSSTAIVSLVSLVATVFSALD
jgi:hypothetical protein